MKRRLLTALLTGSALILLSFQNCGRSGFDTVDQADFLSTGLNNTGQPGKASSALAYELGLDSITYNSCVPNKKGTDAYFTLKATAGGARGGARLTPEFLASAAATLKPLLNNNAVLDVQYKELIEKTNPGLAAQVALRPVSDFRASYAGTTKNGVWASVDNLTDDSWMTPVVESARRNNNNFVGYSNRAPAGKNRFDFNFSQEFPATDYWSSLLNTQAFRACTAQGCQGFGQFHIALGFSEDSNDAIIKSPVAYTTAQTKALGRGYQLQYGYPGNNTLAGARVVKGITEYNLANGGPVIENNAATQWSCTEIPIMSPSQRGVASAIQTSGIDGRFLDPASPDRYLCNPMVGSFIADNYAGLKIQKIREILPPSQWQLGYQNWGTAPRLCVIPVGMDCYPNESFPNYQANGNPMPYPYYVEYNPTAQKRCINEDNMSTELTRVDGGAINAVCAHYITVCTKL